MKAKNYNIKVYNLAGAYLRTFSPASIMNEVSFTSQINGGQGEFRALINIPFASTLITYNNIIKIYESDEINPNGRQIYTGIVGSLKRITEDGKEYIEMRALWLASMLSWILYDSSGSYSFSKNQDPSATIKDVIDRFLIKYPGLISYTGSTAETSGTTANISFAYNKAIDAIKRATDTIPTWWWSIDGEAKLQLHPKTGAIGQIHHKLDMGTDVTEINVEENLEKLINKYVIDYTGGTVTSQDTPSQTLYGIREAYDSKTEYTNSTTAQAYADAYTLKNKTPTRRITLIISNEYDFETIRPGDLVTIRNLDYNISSLQITKTEYNPDKMKIELEDILSLAKEVFTP